MTRTFKSLAVLAATIAFTAAAHAAPPVIGIGGSAIIGSSSLAVGRTTSMNATGSRIGLGSSAGSAALGQSGASYAPMNRQPAYIVPPYSEGNYVVANPPIRNAYRSVYAPYGAVQPPIVIRPNFTPLNYTGLPGDFYARSVYNVPSNVRPIVTYPSPATISSLQRNRQYNSNRVNTQPTSRTFPRR